MSLYAAEQFSDDEAAILRRYVTNLDQPVFALVNLPEVVKGALFARYSRSALSLRRLFLKEFVGDLDITGDQTIDATVGLARADELYARVFFEYGDDSVAQLGGVHLACEQASNVLTKVLEWGRLMSYLEQSTRYIAYTDKPGGRHRYHIDPEVDAGPVGAAYRQAMDGLFDTYAAVLRPVRAHLDARLPGQADAKARTRAIRALALDICRALLPAATVSNVGIFASPQALEQVVMRLRAHPLPEANAYAERVATQLMAVIPDFLTRLDRPDRGGAWVEYLRDTREGLAAAAAAVPLSAEVSDGAEVTGGGRVRLVRWDNDGELRILAGALFPHAQTGEEAMLTALRALGAPRLDELFAVATGRRGNRRHRPGRGFEHTEYTVEVVSDYGAFRDLQRHRLLTVQWQRLGVELGAAVPPEVDAAGVGEAWRAAVARAEAVHAALLETCPAQAEYCATLGHRLRYQLRLNARELMHLVELRTSPQGHESYRRVALEIHRQVGEVAGHRRVAAAIRFVGRDDVHLPRYASEVRTGAGA